MKLKNTFRESGKLFRDVMVVVIGIAITLSLNNWMDIKKEKKDVQHYLNALKMELEDNLKQIEKITNYYKEAMDFCDYLNAYKPEDYQTDSIVKYNWILSGTYLFTYNTSAFEMLKISGAMRLMKNKALITTIWRTYQRLDFLKIANEGYMQRKTNEMYHYWMNSDGINEHTPRDLANSLRVPEVKRYLSFFKIQTSSSTYHQFLDIAEQIKNTIEEIENQKSF